MRFWFVGDFLEIVLEFIYRFVPNYGGAVIIFTLFIRLLVMPLDIKSKRSMRRTQMLQPQINALNRKYKDDKAKLQQKTHELYKKAGINQLSGCLPMLLSLPVLFAMFAVMRDLANVELVKMVLDIKVHLDQGLMDYFPELQSFLWIKNVFMPDSFMATVVPAAVSTAGDALMGIGPSGAVTAEMIDTAKNFLASDVYAQWAAAHGNTAVYSAPLMGLMTITIPQVFNGLFILPILAAVTQLLSNKLLMPPTAAASDNPSAKSTSQMMRYMFPIISIFICATSNAGFALYWVAVNIIQGVQQLAINKWLDRADQKAPAQGGQ